MTGLHAKWKLCLALSLLALAATVWPEGLAQLRYDRAALSQGEIWRVATAHLVHLGGPHLLLDLLGLVLICELLWGDLPLRHGIGLLCFSAVAVSAGLWWLQPGLAWYAGLSGALCGLWAGCALYGLPCRFRAAALLLLTTKLALEFLYGPAVGTAQLIGGEVVTASHCYGALAGAAYVLALRCVKIRPSFEGRCDRIPRPGSEVSSLW